jgi:hypothetical protein
MEQIVQLGTQISNRRFTVCPGSWLKAFHYAEVSDKTLPSGRCLLEKFFLLAN